MKKLYPFIVQIQNLDSSLIDYNSVFLLNEILADEKKLNEIFDALRSKEIVPDDKLIKNILNKGLGHN
jgi:hypothetical protein